MIRPSNRASIRNISDYSPFGALLPGRHSGDLVRHGYQGSECDPEVKGEGNSYTTEYRQLDPRIGRWLSIDPKRNAWESPYASMANNPILFNDKKGDIVPVIWGIVIGIEALEALFVASVTTVVVVQTYESVSNMSSSAFPGPWYTSRGKADERDWYNGSKEPNPDNPNGDKFGKITKATLITAAGAQLLEQVYEKYVKDAPKKNPLEQMSFETSQKIVKDSKDFVKVELKIDVTINVKSGDNLTKIAKNYDTTVDNLVKLNKLENPNDLKIGQKIIIDQVKEVETIYKVPDVPKALIKDNNNIKL